jgi:hypothetical protein
MNINRKSVGDVAQVPEPLQGQALNSIPSTTKNKNREKYFSKPKFHRFSLSFNN